MTDPAPSIPTPPTPRLDDVEAVAEALAAACAAWAGPVPVTAITPRVPYTVDRAVIPAALHALVDAGRAWPSVTGATTCYAPTTTAGTP